MFCEKSEISEEYIFFLHKTCMSASRTKSYSFRWQLYVEFLFPSKKDISLEIRKLWFHSECLILKKANFSEYTNSV